MPDTQTMALASVESTGAPAGFTREYPSSEIFIGRPEVTNDLFDGLQIMWHETRGFELTVAIDEDLNAEDALKLAESIRVGTARMNALKAAHEGRSIWKKDRSGMFVGLWNGPGSSMADLDSLLRARYTEGEGVSLWFDIGRRQAEQYTIREIRKLHREIGRVLDKVEAEPAPRATKGKGAGA